MYTKEQKAYIYSIDEDVTLSKLKENKDLKEEYDFQKIKDWLNDNSIKFIIEDTQDYHFKFKSIKSNPYILYYKGDLSLLNQKIIAIVGPRKKSSYADRVLEKFFNELQGYRFVTVSGMARGVDSLAHNLSIENSIPTIAILGGGLGYTLSSSRRYMVEKIVNNGGLVLSEFPLKMKPRSYTFPQRNRIVAGLSDFVFVPEAGKGSGSLITVDFANKMNIPVYATPNSIFEANSKGLNKYISQNKIQAVSDLNAFVKDKLDSFEKTTQSKPQNQTQKLTKLEKKILDFIADQGKVSQQELINKLTDNTGKILTVLTKLEMKGILFQPNAGTYKVK